MIACIENGYFQKEIARSAYRYQQELDNKEKIIVGVNDFIEENEKIDIPILQIPKSVEQQQIRRLKELKASRNMQSVKESLAKLKSAAVEGTNLMPPILNCAENYVSLGEIIAELKSVFGTYNEQAIF